MFINSKWDLMLLSNGQVISECLFGVIVRPKKNYKSIVRMSALKVFISSFELPGSFWGLPVGFLIDYITY